MDDGFIIIIIALQDCGSPFYAIAGYEAKKYTFFKNTFKEWIIWRHLAFAHTQYIIESSTSFSVVCLSAAKDACSIFINIKPVIRHFYMTSLISVFLLLSFIALLSCLFKLCSLQPTGCRGHFDAKKCEYTMVSLHFC